MPPVPPNGHFPEKGCSLCALPVPAHPIRGENELGARVYCCAGCAAVDVVLEGLEPAARARAMLDIAHRVGLGREQLDALEAAAAEVDGHGEPAGTEGPGSADTADSSGVVEEVFRVSGLQCPSCSWLVEHTLMAQKGVREAHVDYLTEVASIRVDLKHTSRETALASLDSVGYKALGLDDDETADPERHLLRFGIAAILAMNVMMLAVVHYAELFGASAGRWKSVVGALGAAIAIPVVAYCGAPIYRRAIAHLRRGGLAMESLLAIGIFASLVVSLAAFILPVANFYFEIPAMIVAASLGSRLLDRAIRRVGARRVAALLRPRPLRVRALGTDDGLPGGFLEVDELVTGTTIMVPEGDEVPADVEVIGVPLSVSEAVLSGEPHPMLKRPGSMVLAGSEVVEGTLHGVVLRPPHTSALAQIGSQIREAVQAQGELTARADRIAAVFVYVILAAAAATVAAHVWLGGSSLSAPGAWLPAIAVLVVACPCAFSVAASAAMGTAAIRLLGDGVLLRDPAAFDLAATCDVVVFDKTGTLTLGDMDVHELQWSGEPDEKLLSAVSALEASSRHPVAVALRRHLDGLGIEPAVAVDEMVEEQGLGLRGVVAGREVAVGAPGLFAGLGNLEEPDGASPRPFVLFGQPGTPPSGRVLFDDPIRDSAAEAVKRLGALGVEAQLLSGDDGAVVRRCAEELGIDNHRGRVLPDEKARHVKKLRGDGLRVVYVGDGHNDALALQAADVGIAMRHGASMTLESADLVSIRDEPTVAGDTIAMAQRLRRITTQNYVWAIGYNCCLVPVAAVGWLHPAFAAVAMLLSSLTVLANSGRLLRKQRSPRT